MRVFTTLDAAGAPLTLPVGQAFTTYWVVVANAEESAATLGVPIGERALCEVLHPWDALDRYEPEVLARFVITAEEVGDPPPAVPAVVSRLQAKMALAEAELLDAVEAAVAAAPAQIRIYWAEASDFHRAHPALEQMRLAMGWSPAQLDDLFVAAAQVV